MTHSASDNSELSTEDRAAIEMVQRLAQDLLQPMAAATDEEARFPEAQLQQATIYADLQVQFAGQTAHYANVPFQRQSQGDEMHISGTVSSTCSDFKFERPSFLGMSISNRIPVSVDATWKATN